jgi:hypothetical protein
MYGLDALSTPTSGGNIRKLKKERELRWTKNMRLPLTLTHF